MFKIRRKALIDWSLVKSIIGKHVEENICEAIITDLKKEKKIAGFAKLNVDLPCSIERCKIMIGGHICLKPEDVRIGAFRKMIRECYAAGEAKIENDTALTK